MWLRNMVGRFCCFSEKVFLMLVLAVLQKQERGNNPAVRRKSFRGYIFFLKKIPADCENLPKCL